MVVVDLKPLYVKDIIQAGEGKGVQVYNSNGSWQEYINIYGLYATDNGGPYTLDITNDTLVESMEYRNPADPSFYAKEVVTCEYLRDDDQIDWDYVDGLDQVSVFTGSYGNATFDIDIQSDDSVLVGVSGTSLNTVSGDTYYNPTGTLTMSSSGTFTGTIDATLNGDSVTIDVSSFGSNPVPMLFKDIIQAGEGKGVQVYNSNGSWQEYINIYGLYATDNGGPYTLDITNDTLVESMEYRNPADPSFYAKEVVTCEYLRDDDQIDWDYVDGLDQVSVFTGSYGNATFDIDIQSDDSVLVGVSGTSLNTVSGDTYYNPTGTLTMSSSGTFTGTIDATLNGDSVTIDASTWTVLDNTAPVAVGTMSDIVASEGDTNPTIDPSNYFSDADGDTLTYSITTARADGSDSFTETLDDWHNATGVMDADAVGTWTTTITANDGNGGTATQSFTMTVNAAQDDAPTNTAPVIIKTIPDQVYNWGDTMLNPDDYFADTDVGDSLDYFVRYEYDGIIDPINNSILDGSYQSDDADFGTETVTIIATDKSGAKVEQTFDVTINPPQDNSDTNTAPVAVGTMDDVSVSVGNDTPQLDPTNYFTDADDDTLTYTITSARPDGSDSETDSLTEWNSWINDPLPAGDAGDWDITITADDGNGGTATQSFTMTVNAAQDDSASNAIDANILINDNDGLDNLAINFIDDDVQGATTQISSGSISLDNAVDFDDVTLKSADAYVGNLDILDMYATLDSIGQTIDSKQTHAADVNNDGQINILDMYAVLDGIGQAPQTFDLIDQNNNIVNTLNDFDNTVNLTIVANGDVDMSGSFDSQYIASDIL